MNSKLLGAAVATLALAVAVPAAQAQHRSTTSSRATSTTPSAPSATPLTHGAPIAGLCIFSNAGVIQSSAVGKAYLQRMQQLRAQAAAEIQGEQQTIKTEADALIAKKASLSQEQFAQQAQPFQQREQALNATAEQRSRDLQYTAAHQQERIAAAIQPLATTAYEQHHCAMLLNGEAVMAANPAMDLTQDITTALNGRMSTITFDRETAPAQ